MPTLSNSKALKGLRVIWFVLLAGPVIFAVVIPFLAPQLNPPPDAKMLRLLFYIVLGMLIVEVPLAYLMRAIVYRTRREHDGSVNVSAYASANIIFLALMEGVAFFALIAWLLSQARGPHIWIAAVALAIQAMNYPTGAPLDASSP